MNERVGIIKKTLGANQHPSTHFLPPFPLSFLVSRTSTLKKLALSRERERERRRRVCCLLFALSFLFFFVKFKSMFLLITKERTGERGDGEKSFCVWTSA